MPNKADQEAAAIVVTVLLVLFGVSVNIVVLAGGLIYIIVQAKKKKKRKETTIWVEDPTALGEGGRVDSRKRIASNQRPQADSRDNDDDALWWYEYHSERAKDSRLEADHAADIASEPRGTVSARHGGLP